MKVIQIKEEKVGLKPKKQNKPGCYHKYCEVDEQERLIRCQECDAVLDTFEFIWNMAIEESRWVETRIYNQKEAVRLREYRQRLQTQVDNLKEEIKKLKTLVSI